MLLERCDDDYDLIRMSSWLEEVATAANESAKNDITPCVESRLEFQPLHSEELNTAIACVGKVLDAACVDPSQSILECQSWVLPNHELAFKLKAFASDGSAIQADGVPMTSLAVEVMSPDKVAVSCKISETEDGDDLLIAKYLPTKPGKYRVMAR